MMRNVGGRSRTVSCPELDLLDPRVWLNPDDARTAYTAGRDFARALAGAPPAWFMVALGEQVMLLHEAIERDGYGARSARLAATAFESAARAEWSRVVPAISAAVGHA